jgi:hypothetical protein
MNAANRFFAGTTLAIALSGAGVAWGDSSVVGGNVIVNRPVVDSAENFYLVDTNHPLNADGKLDQWEIFAGRDSPVQLVIYRQYGEGFIVVGTSDVEYPEPEEYNLFELDPKIKVKAGDFVGAYFPETGSIVFNYDLPSSPDFPVFPPFNSNDPTSTLIGTTLFLINPPNPINPDSITFTYSSNRHYSLRVLGDKQKEDDCRITIGGVSAQPNVLWPPNHRMVPVTVVVSSSRSRSCDDNTPPVCKIFSVRSNQPVNGTGDGDTAPDWWITGNLTVDLRAERSGQGERVYTLIGKCQDTDGNRVPWRTTVTVPHDQGKK